ncbi:MAG: aminopeptidase P family protein [Candidatus Kuenenia sp.]|nr:aminopeptidase P family protein [Candidatus Kuenenia hertensis]
MDNLGEIKKNLEREGAEGFLVTNEINIRYISGFTGSDSVLLLTPGNDYLFTDFRYVEQAQQDNPKIKIVEKKTSLLNSICEKIKKLKIKKLLVESFYISIDQFNEIKQKVNNIHMIATKGIIENYRKQKTKDELKKIQKAIEIAEKAYASIQNKIKYGVTEKDIADILEYELRILGAEKSSFDIICAVGKHASKPHAHPATTRVQRGDTVLIDWGSRFQYYNSDLTRLKTMDKISSKFRKIYQIVLDAQSLAIDCIRPGIKAKKIDAVARNYIKKKGFGEFFGHGLGHGIGQEVHEGPYINKKNNEILKEGMVFTVEPGIYIPEWGGVRIEDLVLVTQTGCEVLSKLPKKLSDININ